MPARTTRTSPRRVCEVLLDGVCLEAMSKDVRKGTHHLIMVTLIWPRAGIAERVAVKELLLRKGELDMRGASWSDRVLFKETVEGAFGICVGVTEALPPARLESLLRFAGARTLKLLGGGVDDMLGGAHAGGLAKALLEREGGLLGASRDIEERIESKGTVDLTASDARAGQGKAVSVPLVALRAIQAMGGVRGGGVPGRRRRCVRKVGESNGSVDLRVRMMA